MKKITKVIIAVLILIVIQQFYWFNKLNGNVIIYTNNTSERDSIEVNLYLDGQNISSDYISKTTLYSPKKIPLTISPWKHEIVVKADNNQIIEKYQFYSFLIKRVIIEYQGKDNQLDDENAEFLIDSHTVFRSLSIQ